MFGQYAQGSTRHTLATMQDAHAFRSIAPIVKAKKAGRTLAGV